MNWQSNINVTPLIDVLLVVLIIFIITIPGQTHAIRIDSPAAGQPADRARKVVELSIDFDGTIEVNQQPVERARLQRLISQEAAKSPQPEVHIRVDRFARYEIVAQTLADLQQRGLMMIGFVNNDFY